MDKTLIGKNTIEMMAPWWAKFGMDLTKWLNE